MYRCWIGRSSMMFTYDCQDTRMALPIKLVGWSSPYGSINCAVVGPGAEPMSWVLKITREHKRRHNNVSWFRLSRPYI